MARPVIVSAVRTPSGKLLGSLAPLRAAQLGAVVVGAAIERAGRRPRDVDEVIMGQVIQAGEGQNPARQAALGAGLPPDVAALTVNKVCGSSLKAAILAAQAIALDDAACIVAGGQESMSNGPYLLPRARQGYRLGHGELLDATVHDGLWCAFGDYHMGCTGDLVAERYGVSREEQDAWALRSHQRAAAARERGGFAAEIVPVDVPQTKGPALVFDADETIRADTSSEALARLKPVFGAEGTVTAGNAPGVNDGAAAVVVMGEEAALDQKIPILARIVAYATSGIEPELVMMAPVEAVNRVLDKAGWRRDEVDLYELNEAFAVQSVAVVRELGIDPERVNVNGGAVALGHPIGASGARILTTLLHALTAASARRGVAAMCLGGGNGVAIAVERD
ncbi:MAG TPA: acetyl-CoA C-acetyltransferase [Acidobacteriota bacterium]